jgi:hypothetical protein
MDLYIGVINSSKEFLIYQNDLNSLHIFYKYIPNHSTRTMQSIISYINNFFFKSSLEIIWCRRLQGLYVILQHNLK